MASRIQQDTFMDDSDDACPLCVEEFDLSDKNFRPCPCGYQVCQFCYNNIKTNMNGLCPACRRPYDDKNIEWKVVSPEEAKADLALQAKKKALAKQKETERKQVETLSRKHLAGLRVMQKNLVYVVGLNPKSREEDLLQTLRGDQYFGQYGKIIKIVVSKAKEGANGSNSQGIYVTFAREEDAASCIKAVDGSQNGDRILRAQFGTTKYCSAYLRNETCNNRSCMFLHDSGEGYNNVSRQDASKMNANAVAAQGPAPSSLSPTLSSRATQPQPAPQREASTATTASQPMTRHISQEQSMSRSNSVDSSALPSSASWAHKSTQEESKQSSKAASVSTSSPVISHANSPSQVEEAAPSTSRSSVHAQEAVPESNVPSLAERLFAGEPHPLDRVMKTFLSSSYKFTFDRSIYSEEALKEIDAYPPLFDANGGLVRYRMEKEREAERLKQEEDERKVLGAMATADEDENPASGSLQLGGEPETLDRPSDIAGQSSNERGAIQPPFPSSALSGTLPFSGSAFFSNQSASLPINARSLTPQQQQQLLQHRAASNHQSPISTQYQHNTSQHHHQPSNPFQTQTTGLGIPGHTRQASRYTFANDSSSASATVNPSTNAQLMAQQSAMMPTTKSKIFHNPAAQHSNSHASHFYSGVQGPPPGLKSSGTPPISGGGMFGQGHGFTSVVGGNVGLGRANGGNKNGNEELMRELLRGRNSVMNGHGPEVGKQSPNISCSGDIIPPADKLVKDITSDLPPNLLSGIKISKTKVQPPQPAPPGLASSQDFPPLAAPAPPATAKLPRKTAITIVTSATIKPVVPVLPGKQIRTPAPIKEPGEHHSSHRAEDPDGPPSLADAENISADSTFKAGAKSKVKTKIAITSSTRAKARPKNVFADTATPKAIPTQPKSDINQTPSITPKVIEKKHHPGKLDIAAAKDASKKEMESVASSSAQSKFVEHSGVPTMASRPATPATAVSQASGSSTARQVQPRTIRVLPTPKTENPPRLCPASPSTVNAVASSAAGRQQSRRASFASIHPPGTPISEKISDNASYTSTSMSRANSPPPNKVGSAPIRQVTKSQQKKERQVRAKLAEESSKTEGVSAKAITEETVQAPIVGRKKKTKKANLGTADSTPMATRASSPILRDEVSQEKTTSRPASPVKELKKDSRFQREQQEAETPASPIASSSGDHPIKNPLTAASILSSLQRSDDVSSTVLDLFKGVTGVNYRFELTQIDLTEPNIPLLSDVHRCQLENGEALALEVGNNKRVVLLPDRCTLRGLSKEQAQRYLELRKRALATTDPIAFNSSRYDIDRYLHAVPHGGAAAGAPKPPRAPASPSADDFLDLLNRFVASTSAPASAAAATPSYWTAAPLTEEAMARRLPLMGVEDAEQAMLASRKETEGFEKKLNGLLKRNRRLVFGNTH